jgi:hypothetical protein
MSILGVKAVIQRLKGLKAHFLVLWCIVVPAGSHKRKKSKLEWWFFHGLPLSAIKDR